jgi:hypothetical protein
MFARHIQATVIALNWRRTVVIERGVWESRSTLWKPHADNVRNLRAVNSNEPEMVGGQTWTDMPGVPGAVGGRESHEVLSRHTHFEYEELNWHKDRLFTAKGDSPDDLCWPEYTLEPNQQVCERREHYQATFSADADGRESTTEFDEATWRTLKVGRKYRLEVGAFSDEVKQVTPAGTSYSYRGK